MDDMRVAFLRNSKAREMALADAVKRGMELHRDECKIVSYDDKPRDLDCDAVAFVGLKAHEWHRYCRDNGKVFLYFDKGYFYPKETDYARRMPIVQCWRVAVNTNQPLKYLTEAKHTSERWDAFGSWPKPWRDPTPDGHVVLAGSSLKYHMFHGLPDPTTYFVNIARELREYTDRPIHYRPKPSVRDPVPIEGTTFVPTGKFESVSTGAHAIITHGSNAALIGMLMGVPSIILGSGVMGPISSTKLSDIENPYLATDAERKQLLANLAWSQYTLSEFMSGKAWGNIKRLFLQ